MLGHDALGIVGQGFGLRQKVQPFSTSGSDSARTFMPSS
jgi:hypothetical protein